MGVRKSDYEDECGNVDWDAYGDAKADYGDMKYQEWKDEQMEKDMEKKEAMNEKPEFQMSGEDGNAFTIIGRAKNTITKWNRENPDKLIDIDEFQREAMSGDYDKIIQTCMKYFEVN